MNLLDIKEPILINNILHVRDNLSILDYLFSFGKFNLGENYFKSGSRMKKALLDEVQHAGFNHTVLSEDGGDILENPLTIYGNVITNQLSKTLNFNYNKITRIAYNYYCREQFATEHEDSFEKNEISIVYNPHTTDGGTEILGKKYPDVANQAKLFKSNWIHSSWPCVKDKGRVSLNIKFTI